MPKGMYPRTSKYDGVSCSVPECGAPARYPSSLGPLCNTHKLRLARHGTTKEREKPSTWPEYRHWINMIERCEYRGGPEYNNYGGRGIQVCPRWRGSFDLFFADMGPRPSSKHSLDRIDVNGDYTPGNVRWATSKEQARNTRVNRRVVFQERDTTLAEAVESNGRGLIYNTVLHRLRRGWTIEQALTRAPHKGVRP